MKKIAVLGPSGTYSDIACQKYIMNKEEYEVNLFPSINKTFQALEDCSEAILPFENTLDGVVVETLDEIISSDYFIIKQLALDIDFSFVSNGNISDIKNLYVQFKAYGQCLNFINKYNYKIIKTESNIESLDKLLLSDKSFAAIIPTHALVNHEFKTIIPHITDSENNQTRFFVLSKNKDIVVSDKIVNCSIVIKALEDKVGMLYEILGIFQRKNINLTSIMSRPNKKMMGKYIFYFEFALKNDSINEIYDLQKELNKSYDVKILGIYNKL